MALEIKPTPTLKGKDAQRFIEIVEQKQDAKISNERKAEINSLVDKVLSKANI